MTRADRWTVALALTVAAGSCWGASSPSLSWSPGSVLQPAWRGVSWLDGLILARPWSQIGRLLPADAGRLVACGALLAGAGLLVHQLRPTRSWLRAAPSSRSGRSWSRRWWACLRWGPRTAAQATALGTTVCLSAGLLAAVLAQRATAGLAPPHEGPVGAEMTLVTDPAPLARGGVRAEAVYRGKHVALVAFRTPAVALADRLAGEIVTVRGDLARPGPFEERLRHRHLAGRVEVDVVVGWRPGHGVRHAANTLRRVLVRGAASMPARQRSLFLGLVIGDDRAQPPDLTDAFRASGLAHLSAVSGQNVSFVLAVAAPVLRRMRLAPRLLLTLALLAAFALVTRFEPSVLRATAMAAVAAYAAAVGRPSSSVRTLAVAVTGVLLCDPLLVTSLGFQLSVAGASGIVLGARPLQRRLPGPEWLTMPVAVTFAAQLAVAPLLVTGFGSVAVASLPANLLAAPAAGPVMAWGLAAGTVAGLLGEPAAALLHLPTRCLLAWLERVAQAGAGWPLGRVDGRGLTSLVLVALPVLLVTRWPVGRRGGPPRGDVDPPREGNRDGSVAGCP